MALKRALELGAGPVRALALTNLALATVFSPLALWAGPIDWARAWQPAVGGGAYFLGQVLNVLALRAGDVSLVTPLMGAKVTFVAVFTSLLTATPLPHGAQLAAGLTTLGVLIMGGGDLHTGPRMLRTVGLALASSACFAVCDLTLQGWSPHFGGRGFIGLLFASVGLASLLAWPMREKTWPFDQARWRRSERWLFTSIGMTGMQSILITWTISGWGDATRVNVVYSLRALWGVTAVWLLGARVGSRESEQAGRVRMTWRLLGAIVLILAVVLAVVA